MSRFKNMALGTVLVAAVFLGSVLALTASASAAVIFGPTVVDLGPVLAPGPDGIAGTDDDGLSRRETLVIDATGFENLTVSFTIQGIGGIEPNCPTGFSADCWQLEGPTVAPVPDAANLDIPLTETSFGPFPLALASANTIFNLTFAIQVTQVRGDADDEGAISARSRSRATRFRGRRISPAGRRRR